MMDVKLGSFKEFVIIFIIIGIKGIYRYFVDTEHEEVSHNAGGSYKANVIERKFSMPTDPVPTRQSAEVMDRPTSKRDHLSIAVKQLNSSDAFEAKKLAPTKQVIARPKGDYHDHGLWRGKKRKYMKKALLMSALMQRKC